MRFLLKAAETLRIARPVLGKFESPRAYHLFNGLASLTWLAEAPNGSIKAPTGSSPKAQVLQAIPTDLPVADLHLSARTFPYPCRKVASHRP